MATTPKGIVYPTTGDTITPLANRFAALATSADTVITNAQVSFLGTAAERAALAAPSLRNGIYWMETDTGKGYMRLSGAWILWDAPVMNVTTSGSGWTVGSNAGKVFTFVRGGTGYIYGSVTTTSAAPVYDHVVTLPDASYGPTQSYSGAFKFGLSQGSNSNALMTFGILTTPVAGRIGVAQTNGAQTSGMSFGLVGNWPMGAF